MKPTYNNAPRVNKKGLRAFAAGLALGGVLGAGANMALNGPESASPEASTSFDERQFFGQPNLAENLKNDCVTSETPAAIYVATTGDNPILIARKLGAENINQVADEIADQFEFNKGKTLHPGDEVALPLDQLNEDSYVFDHPNQEHLVTAVTPEGDELVHKDMSQDIPYISPVEAQQ